MVVGFVDAGVPFLYTGGILYGGIMTRQQRHDGPFSVLEHLQGALSGGGSRYHFLSDRLSVEMWFAMAFRV
jgi:hypothetical protein